MDILLKNTVKIRYEQSTTTSQSPHIGLVAEAVPPLTIIEVAAALPEVANTATAPGAAPAETAQPAKNKVAKKKIKKATEPVNDDSIAFSRPRRACTLDSRRSKKLIPESDCKIQLQP